MDQIKTWLDRREDKDGKPTMNNEARMKAEISELRAERDAALAASRYEASLCQEALDDMNTMKAERDALISDMQDHIAVSNELALECVELRDAAQNAIELLGPTAPDCCGCQEEWNEAIKQLRAALEKNNELL